MSRYGYGGPHSNGGYSASAPYSSPWYDRFDRNSDGRPGFYDYYPGFGGGYPGGGPSRFEPYPPRMMDRRGVRPKTNFSPKNSKSAPPKKTNRRPSGKRTSAVQFTASRSRLKPPFVISQSKWGNSNRSSWIFPRFGDYIDTEDTPIWLSEDDLTTKFEVPRDNQYCPDCGVLIINAKRHKSSEFHREKVEEKKGVVPRWKLEFLERKKKYEERKAVGGAAGKDDEDKEDEDKEDDSNDEDEEDNEINKGDEEKPSDSLPDSPKDDVLDIEEAMETAENIPNGIEAHC
ncbi:uncharacterized protein LOC100902284 [Galendromus occidentalis]|uniref:Uncharacterized protein LOC100902284 n=1 Tax=Galendromus occidentalis TaxID=34638 RepID=A0AAJ6QVG4_9ACAR|nr:uncharacterized protein LOC100902284 [Galendromus occidentalis]